MPTPETITLGDRTFEVRRPKLRELKAIIDALDAMAGKNGGALIDASADLIAAGLQPAHPDLTAAELLEIEMSIAELNGAVAAVLHAAGLRETETALGEDGPQPDAK